LPLRIADGTYCAGVAHILPRGAAMPVWEKEKPVERVADFKTLIVYKKK
jgi:hypothetical protein